MNETTSMLKELYRIFNALNAEYYNNELPTVFITLKQGKTKNKQVYGTFTPKSWAEKKGIDFNEETGNEVVVSGDERYNEIAMSAEYFTRPVANWCATLQHEMIHLYCSVNDIEDTSNNGHYHNRRFKAEAEKRGLIIEKADTIGWSVTTPSTNFIDFINSLKIDEDVFKYFRDTALDVTKVAPKKRFVCPICGVQVQGKKKLNIVCGECNKRMDYWDLTESDNFEILEDYNNGLAESDEGWIINGKEDE